MKELTHKEVSSKGGQATKNKYPKEKFKEWGAMSKGNRTKGNERKQHPTP